MAAAQSWNVRAATGPKLIARAVVVASADLALRHRLKEQLKGLRWTVFEAGGGAEAMDSVEAERPEALLIDSWLPDLEVGEFAGHVAEMFPALDVLRMDGAFTSRLAAGARSPRRNELLHAVREAQEAGQTSALPATFKATQSADAEQVDAVKAAAPATETAQRYDVPVCSQTVQTSAAVPLMAVELLPEMVGASPSMRELTRLIRLVAPRRASVLIEGETGTGKEVVAKALHRLSTRVGKPFVTLNCAAIPESLLEAELFGHTRGAFTGAVQSRTGRIEAAHGGTLFLDEIGEMPLALQAKMLRFLEYGELQRVGDNETMRVDVRVIAATHQPLEQRAEERTFRLDLYHRLAVFPLEVPALRHRMEDLPLLVEFFLEQMGREAPRKRITEEALTLMAGHRWPGNVRELMHVLERGAILAGDRAAIAVGDIRIRSTHTR